jgi:hypothetical protein
MEFGHLLTCSGFMYPEVSSKVCHDSFFQLGKSVSLPRVIYYEAYSPASFRETCQWLKFPLNGFRAQSKFDGTIATFSLWTGMQCSSTVIIFRVTKDEAGSQCNCP